MAYRLGSMDIQEPAFELCFDEDPLQDELLSAMSNSTQHSSCAWASSIFDMPSIEASTESHHHHHHHHCHQLIEPPSPMISQDQLLSSLETIGSGIGSPDVIVNGGDCTSLTPKLIDLNLCVGAQWPAMPYLEPDLGCLPLALTYDVVDGVQSWQEASHVPLGLEIPDAADDDALQVMSFPMPDHHNNHHNACDASGMQQVDSEQQRARDFWFETENIPSEPMFKPIIPLTPPASENSLLIVSPQELSSATTESPTTTIFTEASDSADEKASFPSASPEVITAAEEEEGGGEGGRVGEVGGQRKKLPDVANGSSTSVDTSFCFLSKRKTDKLAARRRQKRRRTSPSNEARSEARRSSPPFRKIDQMDPLSRQLLDEMLLNDRMPPIGKPIPYSVIMVRLRHLYCGAEETLRGHFRRLTKPKEERVRKPVWKARDVQLLEEAVKLYLDATTKRKISWTAVGDYIYNHGGSYKFGVTACSKKWYSLSK
ncbi:hypothetical protein CP532_3074 [Ophiocordyceps camponoti-leonardi (nom. inval.)]|nr:hypothetical protein CP532_3074 [Ophiocordyceps camponoti-leonardi (nom. inval.)]